jgi:hypothetical protein
VRLEQGKPPASRHVLRSNSNPPTSDIAGPPNHNNLRLVIKQPQPEPGNKQSNNRNDVHSVEARNQSTDSSEDGGTRDQKPDLKNELSGLISRAKEGLSSSSKPVAQRSAVVAEELKKPQKSETELEWEQIEKKMSRALKVSISLFIF